MSQPLVSIIIPTYNRAHLISETLDSVLAQTYTNWECIVVDDGSGDTTDEVLKTYCNKDTRFKYVHRPDTHKPGGNGARNYGFELSKGKYIQWFDSDDVMLPEYLKKRMNLFHSKNILFTICSGHYFEENTISEPFKLNLNTTLFENYVKWNIQVFINSVVFRKDFLNKKELFNPNLIKNQEIELFSRLFFKILDTAFAVTDAPLFLYRRHQDTKSFLSNTYRKDYLEAVAYIHIENFKRAISIRNENLSIYLYKKCVKLLFSALQNNHQKNVSYILKEFKLILYQKNRFFYLKLWFVVGILKIKSHRVKDHFKYLKLNFNEG